MKAGGSPAKVYGICLQCKSIQDFVKLGSRFKCSGLAAGLLLRIYSAQTTSWTQENKISFHQLDQRKMTDLPSQCDNSYCSVLKRFFFSCFAPFLDSTSLILEHMLTSDLSIYFIFLPKVIKSNLRLGTLTYTSLYSSI